MTAEIVLQDPNQGDAYIVVGGGVLGVELALHLEAQGKKVKLVEQEDDFLPEKDFPEANRMMLLTLLERSTVEQYPGTMLTAVKEGRLLLKGKDDAVFEWENQGLVLALGYVDDRILYEEMKNQLPHVAVIGDAQGGRNLMDAIWTGFQIAYGIDEELKNLTK